MLKIAVQKRDLVRKKEVKRKVCVDLGGLDRQRV